MEHRAVDFNQRIVEAALSEIALGGLRVFETVTSTNDEALTWAAQGARDLSLVVADEQTAGRGRAGRSWATPPGSGLALSLVLREAAPASRLAGLGALAVAEACERLGLAAAIKWPNDVLLQNQKVAGVLVEAIWHGDAMQAAVVGIGLNVATASVPDAKSVRYPATSLEASLNRVPDRLEVLRLVVASFVKWRAELASDSFVKSWADRLAFRNQDVTLKGYGPEVFRGRIEGLEQDGSLRLITSSGVQRFAMGELHLSADDTIL